MSIALPPVKITATVVDNVRPEMGVIVISEFVDWMERHGARITWPTFADDSPAQMAVSFMSAWARDGEPPR